MAIGTRPLLTNIDPATGRRLSSPVIANADAAGVQGGGSFNVAPSSSFSPDPVSSFLDNLPPGADPTDVSNALAGLRTDLAGIKTRFDASQAQTQTQAQPVDPNEGFATRLLREDKARWGALDAKRDKIMRQAQEFGVTDFRVIQQKLKAHGVDKLKDQYVPPQQLLIAQNKERQQANVGQALAIENLKQTRPDLFKAGNGAEAQQGLLLQGGAKGQSILEKQLAPPKVSTDRFSLFREDQIRRNPGITEEEIQRKFANLKTPGGFSVATNPDGTVTVTSGKTGKPLPAAQGEKFVKLLEFSSQLNVIQNLFEPAFVGWFDNIEGQLKEATGLKVNEKEVIFRRVVNDLTDTILRLRSGAQINEQEMVRMLRLVPELGKSDKAFLARLKGLRDQIQNSIDIRRRAGSEQGFIVPSDGSAPVQAQSVGQTTDATRAELNRTNARLEALIAKQRGN